MGAPVRSLWLAALSVACSAEGAVRIRIDAPEDARLTPVDGRLAAITLTIESDGMPPRAVTRPAQDRTAPIDLGDVPIADGVRLSLAATSAAGRLVGYGRAPAPIDVVADEVIEVPIRLRRPFAYVAGGNRLAVYDATLERGQAYASEIDVAAPTAVTATPDGAEVLALVGGSVVPVSTMTHQAVGLPAVALGPGATDLTVSPDSRWVAVSHGQGTGVSMIDLVAMRGGAGAAVHLDLGAPVGAVAFAGDKAWVLLQPARQAACGAPSSLRAIDLATMQPGATVPLDGPAGDLAADGASGTLVLAMRCAGQVVKVNAVGDTASPELLIAVPDPTTVAVARGRVFTMGHVDAPGAAHLIFASVGLDGSNPAMLQLAVPEERAKSNDFTASGQAAEVRMAADTAMAYDLAVLPDGGRVAALVLSSYHSTPMGDLLGSPIIPAIDVVTVEYQLIDAETGTALQRMRGACQIDWRHDAFLDDFSCTQASGQDQANPAFVPTTVAVLYGDR